MKEPLKQDSKLRQAQCEELVEGRAAAAVLFHRPSRRCSGLKGKSKMNRGIRIRRIASLARVRRRARRVRKQRSRLKCGLKMNFNCDWQLLVLWTQCGGPTCVCIYSTARE